MSGRQLTALIYAGLMLLALTGSRLTIGPISSFLWWLSFVAAAACGWTLGGPEPRK